MPRIHIATATGNCPALLREAVNLATRQTRAPDGVVIVAPALPEFVPA